MSGTVPSVRGYLDNWPAAIVPRADLAGREDVIGSVLSGVRSGRSVLLAAPRRMGKTSVVQEAIRRLAEAGAITASLDFMVLTTRRAAADHLTRELLSNTHQRRGRRPALLRSSQHGLIQVPPHWKTAELEFGMQFDKDDEDTLFRKALALPGELSRREHTNVVLLLDEFQEASNSLGSDVYGIMRGYFQQQPGVQRILVGSHQTQLAKLFTDSEGPLLHDASKAPLRPIDASAWSEYLERKFKSAGLPALFIPGVLAASGGHPADTMEICRQLSRLHAERGRQAHSPEFLSLAIAEARRELRLVFDQVWASLNTIAFSRLVAARIAHDRPPYEGSRPGREKAAAPHQMIGRALRSLVESGIIERQGRRYGFVEPLFGMYVRETARV